MHTTELAELTLNEIVKLHPATVSVFARYGMDTCCGGALLLRDAAARHRLDVAQIVRDLEAYTSAPAA